MVVGGITVCSVGGGAVVITVCSPGGGAVLVRVGVACNRHASVGVLPDMCCGVYFRLTKMNGRIV